MIVRVIDGDTIVVRPLEETRRPRYTVRLVGIDSPERSPKECGSELATQSARRLAPRGRRVLLKTDPTQPLFDRFDRLLAYAKLRGRPQLNKAQITRGWAKVLVVPSSTGASRRPSGRTGKAAARGGCAAECISPADGAAARANPPGGLAGSTFRQPHAMGRSARH